MADPNAPVVFDPTLGGLGLAGDDSSFTNTLMQLQAGQTPAGYSAAPGVSLPAAPAQTSGVDNAAPPPQPQPQPTQLPGSGPGPVGPEPTSAFETPGASPTTALSTLYDGAKNLAGMGASALSTGYSAMTGTLDPGGAPTPLHAPPAAAPTPPAAAPTPPPAAPPKPVAPPPATGGLPGSGPGPVGPQAAVPALPGQAPPAAGNPTMPTVVNSDPGIAAIIDTEADKNGIPRPLAHAMLQQESGEGAASDNIGQIIPSTAAKPGYGMAPISAADITDPAKNIAFSLGYFAKKAAANKLDLQNPQQWAPALVGYNGGGDPQYAQHVLGRINGQPGPQQAPGSQPATVTGSTGSITPPPAGSDTFTGDQPQHTDPQMAQIGIPGLDPSMYRSTFGDKLMAMGAGMMGARTLGQGLGAGMQAVTGLQSQDRTNNLKYQTDVVAQARANQQMAYQNNMLGLKMQPKPTGKIVAGTAGAPDQQEFIDPTSGEVSYRPMAGNTTQSINSANNTARTVGQTTGTTAANQTLAKDTVKDANDGIDNVVASGVSSAQKLAAINNFTKLSQDPSSGAGSTLLEQGRRYLAREFGLGDVNASSAQLTDAMSKQLAAGGFASIKGVQIKNQREFEFATGQIAKMDTNPQAIVPLIAPMKAAAQHDQDVYQAWKQTPQDDQNAMRTHPGAFQAWKAQQDAGYINSLGVSGGTSQATIQKSPNGNWNVTPSGTKFQIVGTTPNQ